MNRSEISTFFYFWNKVLKWFWTFQTYLVSSWKTITIFAAHKSLLARAGLKVAMKGPKVSEAVKLSDKTILASSSNLHAQHHKLDIK